MYSGTSHDQDLKSRCFSFQVLPTKGVHTAVMENGVSSAVSKICVLLSQIEFCVYSENEIS
jgi:hypothetical protein